MIFTFKTVEDEIREILAAYENSDYTDFETFMNVNGLGYLYDEIMKILYKNN